MDWGVPSRVLNVKHETAIKETWDTILRWMEEILHHLGWLKPYKYWDNPSINWCRISSIHSITHLVLV